MIMGVLVVATGFLLFSAPNGSAEGSENNGNGISVPDEDDNADMTGLHPVPPPEPVLPEVDIEDTPVLTPEVTSVTITYEGRRRDDLTTILAEPVPLRVAIEPVGIEAEVIWTSSNTDIFEVVEVPGTDGVGANVMPVGVGWATLTVQVGNLEAECIIRVRASW